MNKILLSIATTLLFPLFNYAQSNYKPGYIVNLKNDTLKGYIDYKEWTNNPKTFNFKSSLNNNTAEKLTVDNSSAFAISNVEYYEKATVSISNEYINIDNLSPGLDTSSSPGNTVFMKVLIKGKNVSLYSYTDNVKTRFYIDDKQRKSITELSYYVYISPKNSSQIETLHSYRTQLIAIASKYKIDKNLIEKINNTAYNEAELKAVIKTINGNQNQQIVHETTFGTRYFAGVGARYGKLSFKGTNGPFNAGTNANNVFPAITGGIDLMINKNTQRAIFRIDVTLTGNHYNFPYTDPSGLSNTTETFDVKQYSAILTPQFIYAIYSKDNFKVFLDAGAALSISAYSNYYYVSNYNSSSTNKISNYPNLESVWLAFPLKIGIAVNHKLEFYGSYYTSSSITKYVTFSGNISAYQFGINYLFGK